jgi:hypothetical protein
MIFGIVQALRREQSFSLLSSPPRTFLRSFLRRIFLFVFMLFSFSLPYLCLLFVLFTVTRSVVPPHRPDSFQRSFHHSTPFVRVVFQRCFPSVFWSSKRHVSIVFTQVTCVELLVIHGYYVPSTSQFGYIAFGIRYDIFVNCNWVDTRWK